MTKNMKETLESYKDSPHYLFLKEGTIELAYEYFKATNTPHPLISSPDTWCKGVSSKFIVTVWKDIEENIGEPLIDTLHTRVNLFFNLESELTEVSTPVSGVPYISVITVDPENMRVLSSNPNIQYEVTTEVSKYLAFYREGEGFTLFNEIRTHFPIDEVENYTLYTINLPVK